VLLGAAAAAGATEPEPEGGTQLLEPLELDAVFAGVPPAAPAFESQPAAALPRGATPPPPPEPAAPPHAAAASPLLLSAPPPPAAPEGAAAPQAEPAPAAAAALPAAPSAPLLPDEGPPAFIPAPAPPPQRHTAVTAATLACAERAIRRDYARAGRGEAARAVRMSVTVAEVIAVADAFEDAGDTPLDEARTDALAAAAKLARHDLRCACARKKRKKTRK
jgi:hypothetical protein